MKCKNCNNEVHRVGRWPGSKPITYCSDKCCKRAIQCNTRKRFYAWLQVQKDKPCMDCGQRFPSCCMDFDHRPGEIKEFNIGRADTIPIPIRLKEIAKCDLVCANCHRLRTFNRSLYHMEDNINVVNKTISNN